MQALLSGKYDLSKTAIIMTQTGGGCRASNYIGFIRRALTKAGLTHIPVISSKFKWDWKKILALKSQQSWLHRIAYGAVFGDILMKCLYRMRPYEAVKGSANALHRKWEKRCISFLSGKHTGFNQFNHICRQMIREFDTLPITDEKKPRVGIVGEILVKFLLLPTIT